MRKSKKKGQSHSTRPAIRSLPPWVKYS
ncbi:MAG: 30S ribosomal protein S15, partial [Thermoprotei archaeon]